MLTRTVSISWPRDPPTSASQSAGIAGLSHRAQTRTLFFSWTILAPNGSIVRNFMDRYSSRLLFYGVQTSVIYVSLFKTSGSQPGVVFLSIFTHREHLAMSRNSVGCDNCRSEVVCCWHLVGRGQGCCWTSYKAQNRPHNSYLTQRSIVPRLRNLVLNKSELSFHTIFQFIFNAHVAGIVLKSVHVSILI